jgi:hypothetical protein
MATQLVETLEKWGLVSAQAVQRLVSDLPFKEIVKIREENENSLVDDTKRNASPEDSFSPFNFIASASFRGDSGCSSWRCYTRKAEILARYAACFCDRVIVPLSVAANHPNATQKDERYALARGILGVVEMRPVIDAGIVVPAASMFHYCPLCFPTKIPQVERILEIRKQLLESLPDKFWMSYQKEPHSNEGRLTVHGPEDYLEHGTINYAVRNTTSWLPRAIRGSRPVRLTDEQKRKSKRVEQLITQIAIDVSAQQVYSTLFNATYLTNTTGEAEFLKLLHEEDRLAARTATLCAQLTHSIPLFTDLSLERVMKIRREDYAAFESYRLTLSKIMKENIKSDKELTITEARNIYSDVLQPEIVNLEQQAKNERKSAIKDSVVNAGITAGVIALGAYSGFLPTQLTALCAAVGGVKLVTDVAKTVAAIQKNPTKVRNSNLYFLLRLRQEGK